MNHLWIQLYWFDLNGRIYFVIVEGYIKTKSYVDRDNNNRKFTEIVTNRVHFLEKADFVEQDEFDSAHAQEMPKKNTNLNTTTTDDDVPF